jgi:glucuronoarabinoxylan endo-1,4-beta-xylanase
VLSMKNLGVNLYAISIQNEPDAQKITSYEACQWTDQQVHDFVTNLYNALVAKGVGSTKIIAPEGQSWQGSEHFFTGALSDPTFAADVGIIADHNYNSSQPPSGIPIQLPSSGKPTWETETANLSSGNNNGIADGMYWANRIYLFMTVAQANAWHFWWLIGASGSGFDNSNQGLADTNGVPTKRMYVLGQFSRFIRPGYVRIDVNTNGSDLLITAFRATNSPNFAIVAINPNVNIDVTNTFNLTNFLAASVTPWMTSSSNSLAQFPAVPVHNSSFTYFIPAQSIVTFVGQGNSPTPSDIVISSTAYQSSNHSFVLTWNATADAKYSVHKTGVLDGSSTTWPAIVTGYPAGGAVGGPLSYTDTVTTVGPEFYRVSSP